MTRLPPARRRLFTRVLPACLALTLSLPALAATQPPAPPQRQAPPKPGPARDLVLQKPVRFTLPNGLPVALVKFGTVPKVRLQLVVEAGNVNEAPNEVWLADTVGRMMQEGTTALSADELARQFAAMGGELSVAVGPDRTSIATEVLAERGPEALRLLADVAQRPRLPEAELVRVKATLARELAIQKATPQSIAQDRFAALMYGDHPYGRLFPTEAMLAGYTLDDVRRFHKEHFGPRRTRLYVAGVFDAGAMEKAIREALGTWAGAEPKPPALPAPRPRAFELIDRAGAPQSTVLLGLRVPDPSSPDWVALEVTDQLLGGSFASRITSNIREQKGYTYSPSSSVSVSPKLAQWVEQADITTEATGAALKEIFAEIDRLRNEPPPLEELRGIRNNLAGVFLVQNSSRRGVISRLSFVDQHGLGDDFLATYVKRVMAVTPQDVQRIAKQYLVPDRMTLVVVGDTKTVKDQLAPWSSGASP
jgi:predicted Zn-dependent peptidase